MCRSTVGREQDVRSSIVIDVSISRAPRDFRSSKRAPNFICNFLKLAIREIAKQMWRLGIADALLHCLDLIFNVAIGNQNIFPAVVVVIEEKNSRSRGLQA